MIMRTQKHDLKQEIKNLESDLNFAVINQDALVLGTKNTNYLTMYHGIGLCLYVKKLTNT